jgi:protoheme IX farnesyltransferase
MLAALEMTVAILKLRIGSFVALAALVGILTGNGPMQPLEALAFCLAVLGASGAAGAFNHYLERDRDRLMARTRQRPFATGALKPGLIWPVTFTAVLVASLLLAWSVGGTLASFLVFVGAATYGLVYTVWLKARTVWNVVVGGTAGSFAVLAGAAAAAPPMEAAFGAVPVILAAVMFLWTPPHFWSLAAARCDDYREARVPMLPAVSEPTFWAPTIFSHVACLVALSFLPLLFGMGAIYGVFAAAGGIPFLWTSWRLVRDPGRQAAMANFRSSLLQFALLALGVVLDEVVRWAL